LRQEKAVLANATCDYVRVALSLIDSMVLKSKTWLDRVEKELDEAPPWLAPVVEDWRTRVQEEIGFRQLRRRQLAFALETDGHVEGASNVLISAVEVLRLSYDSGVLHWNCREEHGRLLQAISNYETEDEKVVLV
jgi:hypothetical protein